MRNHRAQMMANELPGANCAIRRLAQTQWQADASSRRLTPAHRPTAGLIVDDREESPPNRPAALPQQCCRTPPNRSRHAYYSDAWQLLQQRIGTLTDARKQFIWGLRYIDDLVRRDRDTSDPPDGVLNEVLYATQDDNWNVVATFEADTTVQYT